MRTWKNDGNDGGAVHCMGNGRICAYGQGPDINQLFGPPYSSPSFLRLELDAGGPAQAVCVRRPGSAVWTHTVRRGGEAAAAFTDFAAAGSPCFIRQYRCMSPVSLRLRLERHTAALDNSGRFGGRAALLAWVEAGSFLYGSYPIATRQYLQILLQGDLDCRRAGEQEFIIELRPGSGALYFCSGPSYPEAVTAAERLAAGGVEGERVQAEAWWAAFTARRVDLDARLPRAFPQRERLLTLADSVATLIRAQQGAGGGVLAGHNYHLGYVRDQYGVSRCLLALGLMEEARAILAFYWDVWRRHGVLHNAQGIGAHAFHIHENDDVEITGYLITQAFDYLHATGDGDFIREIFPMLDWAFSAQAKHLVCGMLPFNGDETYIAGGLLPRDAINDGSAEATMLFIESGRRMLSWAEAAGLWSLGRAAECRSAVEAAAAGFIGNFVSGGMLLANNPARAAGVQPRFRHGVCQVCGAFGWTERARGGLYACPACLAAAGERAAACGSHMLKSVSLMPGYIGSDLLPPADAAAAVGAIAEEYRRTGRLPSRPDSDMAVGYDYGLLLYSLARIGHPAAGYVYERMLEAADETDAWVEYYHGGRPGGTRCRPWESGINLDAALMYAGVSCGTGR